MHTINYDICIILLYMYMYIQCTVCIDSYICSNIAIHATIICAVYVLLYA